MSEESYTIPEGMAALQHGAEEAKRIKRLWENGFQRWCDEPRNDGMTKFGACGYGMICDLCSDNGRGRPCVRAWNAWVRENKLAVRYDTQTFEDAWWGRVTEEEQLPCPYAQCKHPDTKACRECIYEWLVKEEGRT